jgi:D-alanine-D-alanine ligase
MRVLPVRPTSRFVYGLEVKRDFRRQVKYECPAQLPPRALENVERAAKTVFEALGCRDVARVDFRLQGQTPYFLEVNPLPGLNPESSDLVILSELRGWNYPRLITAIFNAAVKRLSFGKRSLPPTRPNA